MVWQKRGDLPQCENKIEGRKKEAEEFVGCFTPHQSSALSLFLLSQCSIHSFVGWAPSNFLTNMLIWESSIARVPFSYGSCVCWKWFQFTDPRAAKNYRQILNFRRSVVNYSDEAFRQFFRKCLMSSWMSDKTWFQVGFIYGLWLAKPLDPALYRSQGKAAKRGRERHAERKVCCCVMVIKRRNLEMEARRDLNNNG